MFGKRIRLFKLAGFAVHIDWSWLIIAVLVTWSLAAGVFPHSVPDLATSTYWAMGVAGMLGLFVSIVLHELSHSLAARRVGMSMRGITLFVFGGVAEMDDEPPSAKAEFVMAIAGPLASVAIAAAFFGLSRGGAAWNWPAAVTGVLGWLGWINGVLVVFNLIPAFPLDGGRVLRAALWHWKGSIRRATRITSSIGAAFGVALIVLGVFAFIAVNPIAGMWYGLLGLFLRGAAQMSYQQLLVRRALEGEPLRRFVNPDPVTVPPDLALREFVEDYVYRHHYKMFPVVEDGELVGCVTTRGLSGSGIPRDEWESRSIRDVMQPCEESNTIDVDADAMDALSRMSRNRTSRTIVTEDGRLAGIVALKDMLRFLSLKIELEGEQDRSQLAPQVQDAAEDMDEPDGERPPHERRETADAARR
ncbi:MAG: site-2 protease family protein [Planctomycetes bacterium]|nr:site-2 protease family protein [Planctomycetota bacterium]